MMARIEFISPVLDVNPKYWESKPVKQPVLSVSNLMCSFRADGLWSSVVQGVSFDIGARETVAVVGESGSGKSVTALSIMRLN